MGESKHFIALTCSNCGGNLIFTNRRTPDGDAICSCSSCDGEHIYHSNTNKLSVSVRNRDDFDRHIENAGVWLNRLNDYTKAERAYNDAIRERASDWRGFWGVVNAVAKKFTYVEIDEERFSHAKEHCDNAKILAKASNEDAEVIAHMEKCWEDYNKRVTAYRTNATEINNHMSEIEKNENAKQKLKKSGSHFKKFLLFITKISVICLIIGFSLSGLDILWDNFIGTDVELFMNGSEMFISFAVIGFIALIVIAVIGFVLLGVRKNRKRKRYSDEIANLKNQNSTLESANENLHYTENC